MAVERESDDKVTLYVSWNGATDVATWQVLASPDPGQLEPVGSAPKRGFETAVTVKTADPYIAVQARSYRTGARHYKGGQARVKGP